MGEFEERMKERLMMSHPERLLDAADKLQSQLGDERYMCVLLAREIMAQSADRIEQLEAEITALREAAQNYILELREHRPEDEFQRSMRELTLDRYLELLSALTAYGGQRKGIEDE